MSDLFLPVKVGLGQYMTRFKQSLIVIHNDSAAVQDFANRALPKSMVFAPSRMIDAIEDILSAWRKNTNDATKAQSTAFLPMIAVAIARGGKDHAFRQRSVSKILYCRAVVVNHNQ
jgi:hypothetical protein